MKGTIEPGESLEAACARELREEAGIDAMSCAFLGEWTAEFDNQVWGFCQMKYLSELPENWEHFCADGGGLRFNFFWQPLALPLDDRWHALFHGAVDYIRHVYSAGRLT